MVKKARKKDKRKGKTSFIIIDAQSVKNTDTAKYKGYDAGKKVSGIKRHIAVDSQGLPHAICITTANITDRDGATTLLRQHAKRLSRVKNVMVDGGYRGEPFANSVKSILGETVTTEVAKRDELHTFKVIPKRWVVERSFAWLEKNRRLWKNCERHLNSSLQFTNLAFIALLLKRLWTGSKLDVYWTRHFVRTQLEKRQVPIHLINTVIGHEKNQQEALGKFSSTSKKQVHDVRHTFEHIATDLALDNSIHFLEQQLHQLKEK